MTPSARILRWHYLVAAALVGHCAAIATRDGHWWYGVGLFITGLLLLVAHARECAAADERRATAVRAERAARLRARQDAAALGWDELATACCLRAWETRGAAHDKPTCARKERAA
ncbi:hypothetical protein DMA15_17500 [Streptomyces sp. WAC 01529]|uniref:hypothetical protein n=1 Tax=Streptomyces sp. WAC 01529 TaxID=2203205 RepID=UPI000F720FED|nr:hypothetical protein [Streptomyces sp. WAC 01529]AZM54144.1 hypothetical protein DMA15_17500 [Streptomyces sp. WAC 01529]